MTEVSTPLVTEVNTTVFGSAGRPRSGIDPRLVDENDVEVPRGEIGELIVRSDVPWSMNAGYDGLPEATAASGVTAGSTLATCSARTRAATTSSWTGEGHDSPAGRKHLLVRGRERGEAVRRRRQSGRRRCAKRVAEEEVLVAMVRETGPAVDPRALTDSCPAPAYFMVPRYVRVVDEIPKTETNKPRKVIFRDAGITPDTWDREGQASSCTATSSRRRR